MIPAETTRRVRNVKREITRKSLIAQMTGSEAARAGMHAVSFGLQARAMIDLFQSPAQTEAL